MPIKSMFHPFNYGFKKLETVGTLESVIAFYFHQLVQAGAVTNREYIIGASNPPLYANSSLDILPTIQLN